MKKLLFLVFVIISHWSYGQVWSEDFAAEANGATSGTATGTPGGTWSVTTTPASTFAVQNVPIVGKSFFVNNNLTEGRWESNAFTIPAPGFATISVELVTVLTLSTDYIRVYYRVDGGAEILFAELLGQAINATLTGSAYVSGTTLQIVMRGQDNQLGTFLGVPLGFTMDNLTINLAPAVYSRKNSTWTDVTIGNGTWSGVALGGVSCDCVPSTTQVAVIGGGFTVTLPSNQSVGAVAIQNTGTFQYNTNGTTLNILQGLVRVESGGTINSSGAGVTGEQISFNANLPGAALQVDAGGTASLQDLVLSSAATNLHYINGGGSLTITGDILINASGATLTNNLTTTITATRVLFGATGTITGSTFTNSGNLTLSGNIGTNDANDDNNIVNNSAGVTLTFVNVDALVSGAGAGADLRINNSGTITQSGTFVDIPATASAANSVNNLAGSTWNYSGTGHDTDVRLLANNPTNTFNYALSGAQQIITALAGNGYNNLTLQSGVAAAKTALGNFSVSGNYTRSGSATFANGGFTVTLNGITAAQIVSAVGGETFAGLTINNTFATSPQITTSNAVTVTGTLTMTSGIVNLGGLTFTLGSSGVASTLTRAASTTTNWMYGGSFSRFWLNATAVSSTAGNFYGLFPVGVSSASSYRPVAINSTANPTATGSYTVTHTDASGVIDLSPVFNDGGTNIVRKHNAQFVNAISGVTGGTYNVSVTMTGLLAGTLSDIRLAVNGAGTTVTTVGTHAAATGTAPNPTAGRTGVTLAGLSGDFRITTTNLVATPLPIELISFNASLVADQVKLSWATASELNNDFFTIERVSDLEKFEEITTVKGQGTVNSKTSYTSVDDSPLPGKSYYRLKQTDFDGQFTYSELRKVENSNIKTQFKIYPNPVIDSKFNFELTGVDPGMEVPLRIVTVQGTSVFEASYKADQSGRIKTTVELNPVSDGMYIVIINTATGLRKKILIQ